MEGNQRIEQMILLLPLFRDVVVEGDQALPTFDFLSFRQLQLRDEAEDIGLGQRPSFGRRDRMIEADAEVCRDDRRWKPEATSRGRAAAHCQHR